MKIMIRGNVETTDAIRNKVNEQLGKLNKYSLLNEVPNINAKVIIKVYPKENKQKITVTIPVKSQIVLKAEASDEVLYNAIDKVVEKLESQIRKNKTQRDKTKRGSIVENVMQIEEEQENNEMNIENTFLKAKEIQLKPMDVDEAIMQMNALGHDFFVFKDIETDIVSIVYKKEAVTVTDYLKQTKTAYNYAVFLIA